MSLPLRAIEDIACSNSLYPSVLSVRNAAGDSRIEIIGGTGNQFALQQRGDEIRLRIQYNGATIAMIDNLGHLRLGDAIPPQAALDVAGKAIIRDELQITASGIKFPDGTIQTTAYRP